jgi:hypothetical protein
MALAICTATAHEAIGQNAAPSVQSSVQYNKVTLDDGTQLQVSNVWMYDKSMNNALDHFGKYPQATASMLVNNGYLYVTKFKEIFPSNQELYVYNAMTGEYIDTVEVGGLDIDTYGMRLFEDLAWAVSPRGEIDPEPVLMSGWNYRPTDTEYQNYISKTDNQNVLLCAIDFSNSLKPTVTDISEIQILPSLTTTADRSIIPLLSINDLSPTISGSNSGYYRATANTFIDQSYKITSKSSDEIRKRTGCAVEPFKVPMITSVSKTVFYNDALYRTKSRGIFYFSNIFNLLTNYCDNGTEKMNPRIMNGTVSDPLPLDETAVHTGNAIAVFTLYDQKYIVYASRADEVTRFRVVSFPHYDDKTFDGSELLWELPQDGFQTTDLTAENGENITSAYVNTSTLDDGSQVADIYLYAQGQGMAMYRIENATITTGVENIAVTPTTISVQGKALNIDAADGSVTSVYNMQGSLVLNSTQKHIDLSALSSGVYIARCGSQTAKFTLK